MHDGAVAKANEPQVVDVGGQSLRLTNLDKVLYPQTGTTKGEVLTYYAEVAPVMINYIADRPTTRKRWPNGVGPDDHPGVVFFTKNLDSGTPDWVERRPIEHHQRVINYPIVNDLATLTLMAQLAALELHVPQWKFDADGKPQNPDRLVLDLDPGPGVGLPECAHVAKLAKTLLSEIGMTAMPVTSGSKGIHLYAKLDGSQTSQQASDLAREIARSLESVHGDLIVSDMKKALRDGKVFIDWSQNNGNKTTVAPYSMRGRHHPTVAAPRTWDELDSAELKHLEFTEVLTLLRERGDPLAEALGSGPTKTEDKLTVYRSKRDQAKTPEPVPAAAPKPGAGNSFVIQEHHASRLHWDFRLEHDGVLVSWALPKGPPTDPKKNHLAVQTEDHPLEYGSFEGTIPAGEYGGGNMRIWDSGTFELHKWRDGKEVIVTLHGRPDGGLGGPRKFALIQTGGREQSKKNWLIHLMATEPAELPAPAAELPDQVTPMLATLGDQSDFHQEEDWAFEMKWDGVRVIAYLRGDGVRLMSRRGLEVTATYPEIAESLAAMHGHTAVLDGEIVALDAQGTPRFSLLQNRINLSKPADVARAQASTPVQVVLFDVMHLDGKSLIKKTYDERRAVLDELIPGGAQGRIQVPPSFDGDLGAALETSSALQLEGIVAKRRSSTYQAGRRAGTWLKIKHHRTQEVVVAGWRPGRGRRDGSVGSLLVGVPDGEDLRYVGRVGTGFTDAALVEVERLLKPLARKENPLTDVPRLDARDAHWVEPVLVGEVEFTEWSDDRRLRHPAWRGFRADKSPADIVVES